MVRDTSPAARHDALRHYVAAARRGGWTFYTSRIWVARQSSGNDACIIGRAQRSARGDEGTDHLLLPISHIPVGTGVLVTTYAGTAAEVRDGGHPVEVLPDDKDGGSVVISD